MTNRVDFWLPKWCLFASLIALVFGALAPAPVAAQVVFRACYVPDVGLVYRIAETGLPTAWDNSAASYDTVSAPLMP